MEGEVIIGLAIFTHAAVYLFDIYVGYKLALDETLK